MIGKVRFRAMTCDYMTKYLRDQAVKVLADQVRRIIAVLDEKIGRWNFEMPNARELKRSFDNWKLRACSLLRS